VAEAVIEDDDWVLEINFRGVVNGVRAFLPLLLSQGSGVIVNTSSVFGLVGIPDQSAYCASKFAIRGFTDALRQELRGSGVRAVTVHPGRQDQHRPQRALPRRRARDRAQPRGGGAGLRGDGPDDARARRRDHPRGREAR
jgi:NAD(P)-dependent dehydrogenase (short-subunit alcohol dehydrogenase family)